LPAIGGLSSISAVDAEVESHVPGPYSMVSIGACAAAIRREDGTIEVFDPADTTFYAELKPISDGYVEKAPRSAAAGVEQQLRDQQRVSTPSSQPRRRSNPVMPVAPYTGS
jgi:hypothetical protein